MENNYHGTIIEESLENKDILQDIRILNTKVETATERHMTPWITKWTLHAVEIPSDAAKQIAQEISQALDSHHAWYADFKNDAYHYIIFRNQIFFIDRRSKEQYDRAKEYGLSLGIPAYQVDFHPEIEEWSE